MSGKRFGFILAALGGVVLLSMWGDVSDATEAMLRGETRRPKKVVYWTNSGSPEVDLKRARQFMKMHPDVFVKPNFRESGGFQDILFVSFLSGNPPDYMSIQVADVREMVITARVRPIDDLLARSLERDPDFLTNDFLGEDRYYRFTVNPDDRFLREMDKHPAEAARLLKMHGRTLGTRSLGGRNTLTYNKRLFREAAASPVADRYPDVKLVDGRGEPIPPASWIDFYRKAKVISEYGRWAAQQRGLDKPVCYGLVVQGQRPRDIIRGIRPLASRGGSVGFNFAGKDWMDLPEYQGQPVGYFEYEHPSMLAAFALLLKMKQDGLVLPGTANRHFEDVRTELASGSAAMLIDGWHAALIGAERVPWAADDLGSAAVPAPYYSEQEKRDIHELLELDELGWQIPSPNKTPRLAETGLQIITSLCRHPQETWDWMNFTQANEEILQAECRRGTVPEMYTAHKHINDREWFPYDYQKQVYQILLEESVVWPAHPVTGPTGGMKDDEIFRKWYFESGTADLSDVLAAVKDQMAGYSTRVNENLTRRVKDGVTNPDFWTFPDWDPHQGQKFFRKQRDVANSPRIAAKIEEAKRDLEQAQPGLLERTTFDYQSPESPAQLLWIPGILLMITTVWLGWTWLKGKMSSEPLLHKTFRGMREGRAAYVFVIGGILLLTAFVLYPSAYQIYLSFHRGSGLAPLQYVGTDNFARIVNPGHESFDKAFWTKVLPNTAIYMVVVTFFQMALGLLLASLLNIKMRANSLYRVLFFIPLVTSLAIVSVIFFGLLGGPDSGLNQALQSLGLENLPYWMGLVETPGQAHDWLNPDANDFHTDLWMVIMVGIWHGLPYNIILLLAGLQSISPDLYEAGKVDGANAWQRFWSITIPEMLPILIVIAFHALLGAARAFSVAYVLTEGGTEHSSELVSTYIYKWGFTRPEGKDADLGYASALGIVYSVLLAVLSFTNVIIIARRWKRRLKVGPKVARAGTDE